MVPTQRLEYLIAVAREGSFTRAAQVLHVAQPALSRQVGLLERQLGVQLLSRTPQGVRPTAAGAVLIERAEGLLGELERAFASTSPTASSSPATWSRSLARWPSVCPPA